MWKWRGWSALVFCVLLWTSEAFPIDAKLMPQPGEISFTVELCRDSMDRLYLSIHQITRVVERTENAKEAIMLPDLNLVIPDRGESEN